MNSRHCPHCHCSTKTIKHGSTTNGKQRYQCKSCGKTWSNRSQSQRLEQKIWDDYARGGMSVARLAKDYGFSKNKIRKILWEHPMPQLVPHGPVKVVVMDATYFGRKWGILLVLNAHNGNPLYCKRIEGYERVSDYWRAIHELKKAGLKPRACVIDGKRGVRRMLLEEGYLVQLCQFHQIQTVIQNTTRNPELEPNQELLRLARLLPHANATQFAIAIANWQYRHGRWVAERTYLPGSYKKFNYTHQNSRRAFYSLHNNRHFLFTYEDYPELNIPKTSNMIEGRFGAIKTKLLCHRGCSDEMKWKLFLDLLINGTK